ncbi:MAG: hypothetical protein HYS21_12435 [Deltaproteobacteria bacterium]|nr:hypothetical protein [Deltaproteobacteria bacterium]
MKKSFTFLSTSALSALLISFSSVPSYAVSYLEYNGRMTIVADGAVINEAASSVQGALPFENTGLTLSGGSGNAGGFLITTAYLDYGRFGVAYDGQAEVSAPGSWIEFAANHEMRWYDTARIFSDTLRQGTIVEFAATIPSQSGSAYMGIKGSGQEGNGLSELWAGPGGDNTTTIFQGRVGDTLGITGSWNVRGGMYDDYASQGLDGYIEQIWSQNADFYLDPITGGVSLISESGASYSSGAYGTKPPIYTPPIYRETSHNAAESSTLLLLGCALTSFFFIGKRRQDKYPETNQQIRA